MLVIRLEKLRELNALLRPLLLKLLLGLQVCLAEHKLVILVRLGRETTEHDEL